MTYWTSPVIFLEMNMRAFDFFIGPEQSVNTRLAAAFLGCDQKTLRLLRDRGVIQAHKLPSEVAGKATWRYFLPSLHEYMRRNQPWKRFWDPTSPELPVSVVARLLDVSEMDVRIQRHRGKLKDYTPRSVRDYLLNISRKATTRGHRKTQGKVRSAN